MHGYAEDLAAIHAAGFTDLARGAAEELLGRLSAPARVLELGCGDGTTARLLCEAGHAVHGIDASPAMIALARRRAPHASFAVSSFVDSDLPDQCDVIIAIGEVLGYALDARVEDATLDRVFGRCARALRSGGLLMFDLAGPGRAAGSPRRTWAEGPEWAVLVETQVIDEQLTRQSSASAISATAGSSAPTRSIACFCTARRTFCGDCGPPGSPPARLPTATPAPDFHTVSPHMSPTDAPPRGDPDATHLER